MKTRANIAVDPTVWKQFRLACLERNSSASAELDSLMKQRLSQWGEKAASKKK